MNNIHYYDVEVKYIEDRKGILSSSKLDTSIEVATPPEFAKGMPNIWSPEHLLVAAVNSCLMTTFLAIAENFKLSFVSFECNAIGKLEMVEGKFMVSEIELLPKVIVYNESDIEKADKVLLKSEKACLISNSIKSNIIFTPTILSN